MIQDSAVGARRIGVFGGAFDPPHAAHRAVAEAALRQLALDKLLIVPTGLAWHKSRPLTEPAHRLAMCHLAFDDLPGTQVDRREIERDGPSYTADTLAELQTENPGAALFLIMGADQWLAFRSWRRWDEILRRATVAVANRPLAEGSAAQPDLRSVGLPFVALELPSSDLSATAVRTLWSDPTQRPHIVSLVSPAVARYISDHRLYQAPQGSSA